MRSVETLRLAVPALAATLLFSAPAAAGPLALNDPGPNGGTIFQPLFSDPSDEAQQPGVVEDQASRVMPDNLRRQLVSYSTAEAPGTIIIDTPHTYLYLVLGGGRAIRYGIGVGRDGFTWSGVQTIARKNEWPDWYPPAEMIARQPYLPRMMSGGPGNPLGARALYLGSTQYRIHGTNAPETIGHHVSSGCIRLLNEDIVDLYNRVSLGSKVVVLPDRGYRAQRVAPVQVQHQAPVRQRVSSYDNTPRPPAPINLNPAFAQR